MSAKHQVEQVQLPDSRADVGANQEVPDPPLPPMGSANRVLTFEPIKLPPGSPTLSELIIADRGEW